MEKFKYVNGRLCKAVFVKHVTRKDGTVIYPKKSRALLIWVPVDEAA